MTKFRHLIWMVMAAIGLMLSLSQSFAQQPDVGDQPGLLPDDSVELDPEYRRTAVLYRTTEAPGTIIISTAERHLYLIQGGGRALRYGIGGGRERFQGQGLFYNFQKGRMAGLDAAAGDDRAAALSAALHGGRAGQSARGARDVSRLDGLSHPRHQPAGYDRHHGLVRLLPAGQCRRYRPL